MKDLITWVEAYEIAGKIVAKIEKEHGISISATEQELMANIIHGYGNLTFDEINRVWATQSSYETGT